MRFMIIRKADRNTESGRLPGRDVIAAMGRYHQELKDAGVMIAGDGLLSSIYGARVNYDNGRMSVTDGPFTETKELVAGFLLIETDSLKEAIGWAKRCPTLDGDGCVEIEVRQVIEMQDFHPEMYPDLVDMPWNTVASQARARVITR